MNPSLRGLYAIADTQFLDDAQLVPAVEAAIAGGRAWCNTAISNTRRRSAGATPRKFPISAAATACPFSLTMTSPWQWKPEPTACISGSKTWGCARRAH